MKDKIIIKGRKKGIVCLRPITIRDILTCFFPTTTNDKYRYLGITWNVFREGTDNYQKIDNFIKFVDSVAKPKYIPRFILRLLHLFGNDNSIIRVRNFTLHKILRKLTDNILIMDIKIKWGTLRIYGSFTKEIEEKIKELEEEINPTLEPY